MDPVNVSRASRPCGRRGSRKLWVLLHHLLKRHGISDAPPWLSVSVVICSSLRMSPSLRQQLLPHPPSILRPDEALAEALIRITEFIGVEAQHMEDRGLQVVDVHVVAGDMVAQFVGFAVDA